MKFKHFTMEEASKMTLGQQKGYVLAELIYGLGKALIGDMKHKEISETMDEQLKVILKMEIIFEQALVLFKDAVTNTDNLEVMLEKAVNAPKALNYE